MSIFLSSTETLSVVLDAAPATNQLPCTSSYVDQGASGGDNAVNTTGTTPVTLVGSPAAGVERLVSNISIPNADTATRIVTVSKGTFRLCKITLLAGYQLYYDGHWMVLDASGNFLSNVTVTGGTLTANQGTAAAITAPWTVELSNGTTAVGTAGVPLRIDPTGATTQPVSVGNFPALQNVNLTQVDSTALGAPVAYGSTPTGNAISVNAFVTNGGSGGASNITQWNSVALGSPSAYGTSPGAVSVIGTNAFITNAVTVNQGTANATPWNENVAQWGGSATTLGAKVSASSVPVVIASDQAPLTSSYPLGASVRSDLVSTAAAVNTMNSGRTRVYGISVYANNVILAAGNVNLFLKDGSGTQVFGLTLPTGISTALNGLLVDALSTSNVALVNAGNSPTYSLSSNLTSGSFIVVVQFM